MASPSKRMKSSSGQRGTTTSNTNTVIYIAPQKIQKDRLKILRQAARRKEFVIADEFSARVTHVVSEYETREQVLAKLVDSRDCWCEDVELVGMAWLTGCIKTGHLLPVDPQHRLKAGSKPKDERIISEDFPEYECQRATPLQHHNEELAKALELLEKAAEYKEEYSRCLAFRRGSCVVKSWPRPIRHIHEVNKVKKFGEHCQKVVKEILEDGYSTEVEDIARSDWFKQMELFTSIYGVGPSTANKWINMRIKTIDDAINCPQIQQRDDSRLAMSLAFHDDLTLPVLRREAEAIRELVLTEATRILPGSTVQLTGGFSRGKTQGHDIDLLISHPTEGAEQGLLAKLLVSLDDQGLVLQGKLEKSTYSDDALTSESKGAYLRSTLDHYEKWIGVLKADKTYRTGTVDTTNSDAKLESTKVRDKNSELQIAGNGESLDSQETKSRVEKKKDLSTWMSISKSERSWIARRVDLIIVPKSQYYYALVGWTGSKHFNRSLRLYAQKVLNMKLSSHGLYDQTKRVSLPARSEKEVFDHLKLVYREPGDRNC